MNKFMNRIATGGLVMLLSISGCDKKDGQSAQEGKAAQESAKVAEGIPKDNGDITEKETMQRYFPLAIGNTWTYKKTSFKPTEIYSYTMERTVEAGWDTPKGLTSFVVGRSLGGIRDSKKEDKSPEITQEKYTITGKGEGIFFNVKVEGENTRDGRYYSIESPILKREPNVRWGYVGNGLWETIEGKNMDTKTEKKTWCTIIKPGIVVSPGNREDNKPPMWSIGAKMYKSTIAVPAGEFKNCLENLAMVHGKNVGEVLFQGKPAEYVYDNPNEQSGFGRFRTESFYAKNVGLVKEIQYNSKGEVTYQLELIEFKVK
ncbi:MAG: hypothetical protein KKE50_00070 [Nanoarchaeota archaeon]|nr:hypothetical protein [Nanoarchaeota archaeon]